MSNKTTITAELGQPTIHIERIFEAPREKVFQLFTQKDQIVKWWSPSGEVRIDALDARAGGAWKFSDVFNDQEITFFGYYHEVTAPERIVQTAEFANLQERGHVVLDRYEFNELAKDRTQMILTEVFVSTADRDAAIQSGMETGLAQSYSKLDNVLQTLH
jgi:uncharacterized protein YndB with AHSA1/START domain